MAREYGANAAEVAAAHVAGSFAAGSGRLDDSLDDAAAELDRAFATAPDLAASLLRRDAWRVLPRAGADGAGDAFARYFEHLRACRVASGEDSAVAARLAAAATAAKTLARVAPDLRLADVFGDEGDAPAEGARATLAAMEDAAVAETKRGGAAALRPDVVAKRADAFADAMRLVPSLVPGVDPDDARVAVALAALAARHPPQTRWNAAKAALDRVRDPNRVAETVRFAATGGAHPFFREENLFGEHRFREDRRETKVATSLHSSPFAAEAPLALRVVALAEGAETLRRRVREGHPSEFEAGTNADTISENDFDSRFVSLAISLETRRVALATAAATRDAAPTVARASLQTLEDAAAEHQPRFDAAALARSWIAAGERLGNVAAMLAAARDEGVSLERTLGDADGSRESPLGKDEKVVVESVESESTGSIITNAAANAARDALDAALAALAEDPLGDGDGAVAARRVVVDALGAEDAETKVGETKTEKGTSSSASALAALAAARRAAHATLRAFARGDAPRAARGVALELLGVVAGDDDSYPAAAGGIGSTKAARVGAWGDWRRGGDDDGGEKISGVGGTRARSAFPTTTIPRSRRRCSRCERRRRRRRSGCPPTTSPTKPSPTPTRRRRSTPRSSTPPPRTPRAYARTTSPHSRVF